ncbi:MAG: SLC13 family permease [Candidatus Azotimanducaceae bacterium]
MQSLPELPNLHALAVMSLTVITLYLFTRDNLRLELTSLGLLVLLAVGFSIFPLDNLNPLSLFYGFAHEALIAVCALMVLGQGLVRTGALVPLGIFLGKIWNRSPGIAFLMTLVLGAILSAFVNNTPVVVLLLPILIGVCSSNNTPPSEVLMPMGFATLIGGMATSIGTSTNLLVVNLSAELGGPEFEMFDFALPAIIVGGIGVIYLWLIAPKLLPERTNNLRRVTPRLFDALISFEINSSFIGKTLIDANEATSNKLNIMRIRRGDNYLLPLPDVVIQEGDKIRVKDSPENLKLFEESLDAKLNTDKNSLVIGLEDGSTETETEEVLAEIAIAQGSILNQTNLARAKLLEEHQITVLALHRAGKEIWQKGAEMHDIELAVGDILLIQGKRKSVTGLKQSTEFLVLDSTTDLPKTEKSKTALLIILGAISIAALGILPIAVSAIAGVAVLLMTRCIRVGAAIEAISPSIYFVVAASLALGLALQKTGATEYLTQLFLYLTDQQSPVFIMSALMLLLAILTNVVSNNAAAVIGTPIGLGIANQLGLPAEPFVLAVLFGANMSYATPMAYKTNLLVMSAGNYTFSEFVKVGVPLTLLMWMTLTWLLAWLYF